MSDSSIVDLRAAWAGRWAEALALWSRFTRLREPLLCLTTDQAKANGLDGSFAMIRLSDQAVVVDLEQVQAKSLDAHALAILAHEIGHHVYCPADLTDQARLVARILRGLPGKEGWSSLVANLYTDLLINDRLQRSAGVSMAEVYRALVKDQPPNDRLWTFYMRIYEILWSLPKGSLASGEITPEIEGDSYLGARLLRSYARQWLEGAGRFAALCLPYLEEDPATSLKVLGSWHDTRQSGSAAFPHGLTEIEEDEIEGAIHPALDPVLSGLPDTDDKTGGPKRPKTGANPPAAGQRREPFEYGQILKNLGMTLNDHEIAVRYYRERAMPHLVRYPARQMPESVEPLPEGLEPWDIGSPIESADWTESVMLSPRVIPGLTTVQRTWGTMAGAQPERQPLDLDLYVDCSGSMPNPQVNLSYPTLAGAIVALSALRAGARVQATLWSGPGQFETTTGFVRDEHHVLRILTGYLGGTTAFPIHVLRDTYQARALEPRPTTILIISDDGVTTLYEKDEKGNNGWDVSAMALRVAQGGGTMVLNTYADWEKRNPDLVKARAQGWQIVPVSSWEDLVAFARLFSARTYSKEQS